MAKAEALSWFVEENEKSSTAMIQLSERTAWAMQENFSNVFYDGITGELKTFKDYFRAFTDSLARGWSDLMGQMATEWIFGQDMKGGGLLSTIGGAVSGFFGGGAGAGGALEVVLVAAMDFSMAVILVSRYQVLVGLQESPMSFIRMSGLFRIKVEGIAAAINLLQ